MAVDEGVLDEGMHEKTCPQCGAMLFEDMDMCFECLHAFGCDEAQYEDVVPEGVYAEEASALGTWQLAMKSDVVDVRVAVPTEGLVVGRGESCDVVLHARSVSRRHVRITIGGDCLLVEDLGARNPALVNGSKFEGCATLRAGDVLDVCGVTFVAELQGT